MSHQTILLLLAGVACAPAAGAQGVAGRINAQRDGYVGISYAARPDVCSEEGLPTRADSSVSASIAAGSIGVVAAWSR